MPLTCGRDRPKNNAMIKIYMHFSVTVIVAVADMQITLRPPARTAAEVERRRMTSSFTALASLGCACSE